MCRHQHRWSCRPKAGRRADSGGLSIYLKAVWLVIYIYICKKSRRIALGYTVKPE